MGNTEYSLLNKDDLQFLENQKKIFKEYNEKKQFTD